MALYSKYGLGGQKVDSAQVLQLLEQAAKQGHRDAEYELGLHNLSSNTVTDQQQAGYWLLKSAEKGHADALVRIAEFIEQCYIRREEALAALVRIDEFMEQGLIRSREVPLDVLSLLRASSNSRLLATTLAELELSERAANCLRSEGILTLGDAVVFHSKGHLLEIRYLSETIFKEIEQRIAAFCQKAWLRQAATLGHVRAQFLWSQVPTRQADAAAPSEKEHFTAQNEERETAMHWLRSAAERGHVEAQFWLGAELYSQFERLHDDLASWDCDAADPLGLLAEAIEWLRLAAERGHADARLFLYFEVFSRKSGITQSDAIGWLRALAEEGNARAIFVLGQKLAEGGLGQSALPLPPFIPIEEGRRLLRKLAEKDDPEAQYELAHLSGSDNLNLCPFWRDITETDKWYRRSAELGHKDAMIAVLRIHRELGAPKHQEMRDKQAAEWALELAEQFAASHDGEHGFAIKQLRKAACLGHTEAQFRLGQKYEQGLSGLVVDQAQAARWYRRAAQQNHLGAQIRLVELLFEFASPDGLLYLKEALKWCERTKQAEKNEKDEAIRSAWASRRSALCAEIEACIKELEE